MLLRSEQLAGVGLIVYLSGLSGQADKDAEREVLAVAVAEDEFAEVKRLVGGLHAESLLYDCFSKYGRITI